MVAATILKNCKIAISEEWFDQVSDRPAGQC